MNFKCWTFADGFKICAIGFNKIEMANLVRDHGKLVSVKKA